MPGIDENAELEVRTEILLDKTAAFCSDHLDDFYKELCVLLIDTMADLPEVPFARGSLDLWAAAVIHALGSANFLFDPKTQPYVRATDIAAYFGSRPGSVSRKASDIGYKFGSLRVLAAPYSAAQMRQDQKEMQAMAEQMAGTLFPPELLTSAPRLFKRNPEPGEFIDDDHDVMDDYYRLMDGLERSGLTPAVEQGFRKLIQRDPDFFDSYTVLADLLGEQGRNEDATRLLKTSYERAVRRLTAPDGEWPRKLEWQWLENRHLMRSLYAWANRAWKHGEIDDAIEIFRHLLQGDPRDSLAVRFPILGIRMNMSPEEFNLMYDDPNPVPIQFWFDKHAPEYPHEFSGWFDALEAAEGESY